MKPTPASHSEIARLTAGDLAAHLDHVKKTLVVADMRAMLGLLQRLERAASISGLHSNRIPFSLVAQTSSSYRGDAYLGGSAEIVLEPWAPCRLAALLVVPDTAEHFVIDSLTIGKVLVSLGSGPLALHAFSLAYVGESEKLGSLMAWKTDECPVGAKIKILVRRVTESHEGDVRNPPFRGVLWATSSW